MKEKDYIEELITKNLEELNSEEPLDGHFDRFENKLNTLHKKNKFNFNFLLKVAAAIIFVLLASNQAFIYFSTDNQNSIFNAFDKKEVTLSSVSQDYQEVEFYYTNAINTGLDKWNSFASEGLISDEEQQIMNSELADFERQFKTLQSDLKNNPNDQRVISAMLEYYQSKLNVINLIVTKLQEVQQTNKNYETNI